MTTDTSDDFDVDDEVSDEPVEKPETVEVSKIDPNIIVRLVSASLAVVRQNPGTKDHLAIFMVAKNFAETLGNNTHPTAMAGMVFAYYLEGYRSLAFLRKKIDNPEEASLDPEHLSFYNEAALSLFDLYIENPHVGLTRRLLPLASEALHEIITVHQSADTSISMKDAINHLSTIALLSQTVKDYVKGHRRLRNFTYIKWLKAFIVKAVNTPDLSFMDEDKVLKHVVVQVTRRDTVISLLC